MTWRIGIVSVSDLTVKMAQLLLLQQQQQGPEEASIEQRKASNMLYHIDLVSVTYTGYLARIKARAGVKDLTTKWTD